MKNSILKKIIALILVLGTVISFSSCELFDYIDALKPDGGNDKVENDGDKPKQDIVVEGDIQIHFLELGNKYTGDCTYYLFGKQTNKETDKKGGRQWQARRSRWKTAHSRCRTIR